MKKIIILLPFLLLLVACSSKETPSDSVEKFYTYAIEGEYSKMEKYLSPEFLQLAESKGYSLSMIGKDVTGDGRIVKVEAISEEIKGEGAVVEFKIFEDDGDEKTDTIELMKYDNVWKVTEY